ncbi:MAG: Gfo/Idh/MocA family oxidoreductase [Verrucomicrobiota bacterium]
MKIKNTIKRREFTKWAGLGVGATLFPQWASCAPKPPIRKGKLIDPSQKVRVACIGCGNRGALDIREISDETIVALCDVDERAAQSTFEKYPTVPRYKDFRVMLKEMDDQIDAVSITTPDHTHFAAGMASIERGKHVFIQKPLTVSIADARRLTEAARKHEVMTVMGNQGHTKGGCRSVKEWVDAGLLGDVTEVHVWTNKLKDGDYRSAIRNQYPPSHPVPKELEWDLWLGPAPEREYSHEYAPLKWRGFWELGNGALGDIGCHTMDAAFYALNLGAPTAVTAKTSGYNPYTFPDWSIITYEFPARGSMPPVKMVWYDGGKLPPVPAALGDAKMNKPRGYYMIGSNASVYDPGEKCESPRLIPEMKRRELKDELRKQTIPRVSGGPGVELMRAIKGGPKPGSNFDYAGPLTEMVLLGNIAIRAGGNRIEWDAASMKVTNMPELNAFVDPPARETWG